MRQAKRLFFFAFLGPGRQERSKFGEFGTRGGGGRKYPRRKRPLLQRNFFWVEGEFFRKFFWQGRSGFFRHSDFGAGIVGKLRKKLISLIFWTETMFPLGLLLFFRCVRMWGCLLGDENSDPHWNKNSSLFPLRQPHIHECGFSTGKDSCKRCAREDI